MYHNKSSLLPYLMTTLSLSILTACGGSSSGNSAPTFSESSMAVSLAEDSTQTISISATDADGDQLTYSVGNAPASGALQLNPQTGEASYTPNSNYFGSDSFEVLVSDGNKDSRLTVSLTVTAVNDAPVFSRDTLLVSGNEIKVGSVSATDVDEDTLTYTLVKAPENGLLTLDATSGEVSYQLEQLIEVDDVVIISVSDGTEEVQKRFQITTNLATNADRAYYYYTSELSHLKQAATISENLNDDINQSIINRSLAIGYANAELTTQVDGLLNDSKIISAPVFADAKLRVANEYQQLGKVDEAEMLRLEAKSTYNQYLASKGVNSFNGDDVSFYIDLSKSYKAAGDEISATGVFDIVDLLFSSVLSEEYNRAALFAFFGYSRQIEELIKIWEQTNSDKDIAFALLNLDKLYDYANRIGYQNVSNDRNGNLGKPFHSVRQVALVQIIEFYTRLNARDKAKAAAADLLALHGVVNYDPLYPREASLYSAVSMVEYPAGVAFNIKPIVVLYPEIDPAIFIKGIPEASWMRAYAASEATDAKLMALTQIEPDGNKALALVLDSRDEAQLRNHFTNLVNYNSSTPGLAIYRLRMADYAGAVLALEEAENLVSSAEYVQQNLSKQGFVTGNVGCQNLIEVYNELALDDSDNATQYQQASVRVAKMCVALAKQYYADGVDGTDVSIEDAVQANSQLIEFLYPRGLEAEIEQVLAVAETNLAKYNPDSSLRIDLLKQIAGSAFKGGDYARANTYYDRTIELIIALEKRAADSFLSAITERFLDQRGSTNNYPLFIEKIDQEAGLHADYAALYSHARAQLKKLIDANLAILNTASNQTQINSVPFFATQLAGAAFYQEAQALMQNQHLGPVEKAAIQTKVATALANQNHFPGQSVASVDTDHDGLPNFFSASATEAQIQASGLVLDNDSDNDGYDDLDDSKPLDPTVH